MPPHLNETVPGRTRCRTAARAHFSPPARLFQPLPSPRAAVGDYRLPALRAVASACAAAQPAAKNRPPVLPDPEPLDLFQLHSEKTCLYMEFRSVLRLKWPKDSEKTCLYPEFRSLPTFSDPKNPPESELVFSAAARRCYRTRSPGWQFSARGFAVALACAAA